MKVIKYQSSYKTLWNQFVKEAKNTHFFFYRDFMEYHSERFEDCSLLFFDAKERLVALLPANLKDKVLYSHQGLTFGGLILGTGAKVDMVLGIFETLISYSKAHGIEKIYYKSIPSIYHKIPAEEDLYALYRNNASLSRRDVTSTIFLQERIKYQNQRQRAVKRAIKSNLIVEESHDFEMFWDVLTETLQSQHKAIPVHSVDEIKKLSSLFQDNIKLYLAKDRANKVLAGTLLFINGEAVHTQYLANSVLGKKLGALDLILDRLINELYISKKYFDFGISTENNGEYLNQGLIAQKEGFGGRAIVHDFYEISIT